MKNLHYLILLTFFFSSCANLVQAKRCNTKSHKGDICYASFDEIHPTQFVLGKLSIASKTSKVEKMENKGKIEKYLKSKSAPAIIGPDGLFYITDRHHTSFSILNSRLSNRYKKLYIKVIKNWSTLSYKDFSRKMTAHNFAWLRDENHKLRAFSELPKHINNLGDDPYRSLAWLVRENGGFKKSGVSFQEFYWGMFFKVQGIKLYSSSDSEVKSVLKKALKLAHSRKASHLPGYIKK